MCNSVKFETGWNYWTILKIVTAARRHKPLLLSMWPGVLFLVQFNNFDRTVGFYWSYMPPVLMCSWYKWLADYGIPIIHMWPGINCKPRLIVLTIGGYPQCINSLLCTIEANFVRQPQKLFPPVCFPFWMRKSGGNKPVWLSCTTYWNLITTVSSTSLKHRMTTWWLKQKICLLLLFCCCFVVVLLLLFIVTSCFQLLGLIDHGGLVL